MARKSTMKEQISSVGVALFLFFFSNRTPWFCTPGINGLMHACRSHRRSLSHHHHKTALLAYYPDINCTSRSQRRRYSFQKQRLLCGLYGKMELERRRVSSRASRDAQRTTHVFQRNAIVLILRHLIDRGYRESYEALSRESGMSLQKFDVAVNMSLSHVLKVTPPATAMCCKTNISNR